MPALKPQLSITLPRNFIFHYEDGQVPQTPEDNHTQGTAELSQPPPPPRQTFRVRRRRQNLPTQDLYSTEPFSYDNPIPSIEATDSSTDDSQPSPELPSEPAQGFLAPGRPFHRFMSPPATPLAQLSMAMDTRGAHTDWMHIEQGSEAISISRPASSCSNFSDSSTSSRSSRGSFPSGGGSCTSPESDIDPFVFSFTNKPSMLSSPLEQLRRPSKRRETNDTAKWTEAMDTHLWITYLSYLQDPTVTPFKLLPGTAPPLGVCHRVAREAKRSWKGPRAGLPSIAENGKLVRSSSCRASIPAGPLPSMKGNESDGSGSATPTGSGTRKPYTKWPRSESATRKRLRRLCKRRPSLPPYYQRLMPSRSPSPFTSARGRLSSALSSPFDRSSFSTRELNLSLATTTSSTMQPGAPLSQLTSDIAVPEKPADDWFSESLNNNHRAHAHQKSQSLHLGLGLGVNDARRLASPFVGHHPRPNLYSAFNIKPPLHHTHSDYGSTGMKLDSALELHAPIPLKRSVKRRAQNSLEEDLSPKGSNIPQSVIRDLFGPPSEIRHRCVRSRGFSLGDAAEGVRNLSDIFTPQAAVGQFNRDISLASPMESGLMPPPSIERMRQLGSPFAGTSTNTHSNTFPRSFSPPPLDYTATFAERLGPFNLNDPAPGFPRH